MKTHKWILIAALLLVVGVLSACYPNPLPPGLTPVPSLGPQATVTLLPAIQGAPTGQPGGAAPTGYGGGVAADGAAVFEANCTTCHGNQAQGVSGPALRNNDLIKTDPQRAYDTIVNGVPGTAMPAWILNNGGPLNNQQINNVVAYLVNLQGVSQIPSAVPQPEEATETPPPAGAPTPEPAHPSNPGNPGQAINLAGDAGRGKVAFGAICAGCHGPEGVLGIPNPGSEDGSVPPLNPIDPTIVNPDAKVFATNIDLFLEHGSVPDGPNPLIVMPSFGDYKLLDPQQIADIIAYVISLNK